MKRTQGRVQDSSKSWPRARSAIVRTPQCFSGASDSLLCSICAMTNTVPYRLSKRFSQRPARTLACSAFKLRHQGRCYDYNYKRIKLYLLTLPIKRTIQNSGCQHSQSMSAMLLNIHARGSWLNERVVPQRVQFFPRCSHAPFLNIRSFGTLASGVFPSPQTHCPFWRWPGLAAQPTQQQGCSPHSCTPA